MPAALILFYHSVSLNADFRVDPGIVVSPANFERQLEYLSRRMRVIPLAELVDSVRSHHPLPPNSTVITFDDGYRDNLTTALPLLQRFGLPATFFLAAGAIGSGFAKWEDRLCFAVHNTTQPALHIDSLGDLSLATQIARSAAFNRLVAHLSRLPIPQRTPLLDTISTQAGIDAYPSDVMLTWDEARHLASGPLVTIGSHTVRHERLSLLSDSDVHREISEARKTIEAQIGRESPYFAYPYGTPADFDTRAVDALRAGGFACGLTTVYGRVASGDDPFRLKRVIAANSTGLSFSLGTALRASAAGGALRALTNAVKGSA